jgi:N utilization substance protein A
MIDLKLLKKGLEELTVEKKLPEEKVKDAIEKAFASAYQKEYGEKGQIIKCSIDFDNNTMNFVQNKIVVDKDTVRDIDGEEEISEEDPRSLLPRYNEERHIMIETARLLKRNAEVGEEISFPLEERDDFGRIALQTAKQVIMQNLREAEREMTNAEFKDKLHTIVNGTVERVERNFVFVQVGKTSVILPVEEQIPGEKLMPGSRIRAYLVSVDDGQRGVSIKLSRSHPNFITELFKSESSEIADGIVQIVSVAREPGNRSKIAVLSNDPKIDPIGACVGQRGVRVNTITQELHGERIDIVLHSEDPREFIKNALSPAKPISIEVNETEKSAVVKVLPEEQSLAIGKGGQNVRLAARLTGYRLDIIADEDANVDTEEEILSDEDEMNA